MHHQFRRLLTLVMIVATVGLSALADLSAPVAGKVRVKLQTTVAKTVGEQPRKAKKAGALNTDVKALNASMKKIGGMTIRPLFPANPKYAAERAKFGLDQWFEVTFDENVAPAEARKVLGATEGVQKAEVVRVPKIVGSQKFIIADAKSASGGARAQAMPFNDPRLSAQWHYQNDGSINGATPGADINLFNAWKVETGKPEILVAIIDGGVDYTHEDLARNMYVNEAELNGLPGVDDDGNGYVDDVYGFNFCTNSATIYPHSHGTHVAGTVAAVNNNGIGVAGVAGGDGSANSGVRMISCQVFDSRQGVGEGDFAAAIVYAAEMGATIAQCSWGWDAPEYYEQAVLDAIDYFTKMARSDNMTGGLCIFAAGNNGETGNYYPGCYEPTLAVAAMTPAKTVASYSNYGKWVDVTAPGGLLDYGSAWGVLSTLPNNSYGWNEGTSMAAPHVSGIAALLLSHYKDTNFSPSMVRQQIESSVNDLYSSNPGREGLYGSGYVDATKALNFDADGTAPSAVTQFNLLPAQDNITVEWTIPAATYDVVDHCVIYYSTTPFTAADLSSARTVNVDTKFYTSGQTASHEISGLAPLTEYYVAIKAVSNQGKASDLSEVKRARTNAGPKMTIDANSLNLSNGSASFNIGNDDEGLLRWSYRAGTKKFNASAYSNLKPVNIKAFGGKLAGEKVKSYAVVKGDDYVADDYPKNISYFDVLWARIGENDKTLPNSLAQMFTVDPAQFPDGFNMTALNVDGAYGEEAYFEIYRGGSAPMPSNLVCKFTPNFFAYNYNMALPEQLYFAPGENFWICVHFPVQEAQYPLGLAVAETEASAALNALMSNDLGKTWVQLKDALRGSSYESIERPTWAVRAISLNPDWSKMLTLDPTSGAVRQGETQKVDVSVNTGQLVNGDYTFNLHFDTNESTKNEIELPVSLKVSGQKPDVRFGKVIDFGSLLVGQSKTLTVEVFNAGYGNFGGQWGGIYSENIASTNANFQGPDYLSAGFPARSTTRFEVTFAPVEAGPQSGVIVITDKNGTEFRVNVTGVATEPAKITVDPATVEVGDLEIGADPKETQFTITNDGKFPLQFVMPKYSDEAIDGASSADVHRFGYMWTSNLGGGDGFAYDGNPDLIDAVNISSQFSDHDWWSDAIDLGFKFPYYGKEYDQIYVNSLGALAFKPYLDGSMGYPPVYPGHSYLVGGGWITAFGNQVQIGPNSRIEYAKADGKFVVRFKDVLATVYASETTPITFHIALNPNGDVEMYYDDYAAYALFNEGRNLYCGLDDPDNSDPITVTSSQMSNSEWTTPEEWTAEGDRYQNFMSGTAVRFAAPAPNMISSIAPTSGIVSPGESVTVKATVQASDDMNAGATLTNLIINTNDLVSPTVLVPFTGNVTGDRKPEFAVNTQNVDFGEVFRTSDAKRNVTVSNNGHAPMNVTAATVDNGKFNVQTTVPFTIEPGRAKDIIVALPTEAEGAVSGTLTITSDAGSAQVALKGKVIGCPGLGLSYESVEVETESGNLIDKPLTVTNNGNEPLVYSINVGENLTYNPDFAASSGVGYTYSARLDDNSVSNDWIDIETNGLGTQTGITYYMNHDYVEVELPFKFPFYGNMYDKLYLYNTGFVSFTKRTDEKAWPEPPSDFPENNFYTNIIAPYWGLHSMDETKTAGTFHYVTGNQVVISFIEYGNSMNVGVDFQLVMNADGTFHFVYRGSQNVTDPIIFNTFGLAGISDESGRNAVRLADRYIAFGNAVKFSPVVELTLAPNQSAVADIKVDANVLAGNYNSAITVSSNVPSKETVEIPVALTVTGSPVAVFPTETMTIKRAVGEQSTDFNDPLVQMGALYSLPFEVKNDGTAPFAITNIHYDGPMGEDWGWGADPVFMLFYYGEQEDFMTGEMTKTWMQYPYEQGEWMAPVLVGKEPVKFALPMLMCEQAMTPGEYPVKLTFDVTGLGEQPVTREVNFKFTVTPAPSAYSDDFEGIYIKALSPNHKETREVVVTNNGEGTLEGTVYVDLTGQGEEIGGGGGGVDPLSLKPVARAAAAAAPVTVKDGKFGSIVPFDVTDATDDIFDAPGKDQLDYRRALYHPHSPASSTVYNYGSSNEYGTFKSAIEFVAPEGGFNISHVYTMIKFGNVKSGDYKVDIVNGTDLYGGEVVASGVYRYDGAHAGSNNTYQLVIPLDRAVYMAEGQEFNIVITYPTGEAWPGVLVPKQDKFVSTRYRGWVEDFGWFDVADIFQDQYGSLGWVCSALETEEGSAWLTLDGDGTFTVAPGKSTTLNLKVNAASAPLESGNSAMLVFKMNDPNLPLHNMPVVLDRNAAPKVKASAVTVEVAEAQKGEFSFTVTEPEGEDLVLTLTDKSGLAKIASVTGGTATKAEGDADVWNVTDADGDVVVNVEVAPTYGDNGSYEAQLKAADKHGTAATAAVNYIVTRTNREPVAVEMQEIELKVGESTPVIDLNTLFNEPDGEDLSFDVKVNDLSVVEPFVSSTSAIFVAKKIGSAVATVEATDESGAKTANQLKFTVTEASGVNEITMANGLSIWPNPVVDRLNVKCGADVSEIEFTMTSMSGATVMKQAESHAAGRVHELNVEALAAGAYVLTVKATDGSIAPASYVIIKE